MATASHTLMTSHGYRVTYGRPVIGPKHYVAVAGNGWTETFVRAEADSALQTFAGKAPVSEMVNNFLDHMELSNKSKITWSDITIYLGRIARLNTDKVPMNVGVAFWARIVQIEDAKESN